MEYIPGTFDLEKISTPVIDESVFLANSCSIIGDVKIGKNSSVWFGAVLRGDMGEIRIGENCNIQDNSMIHVDFGYPSVIGDNVSVGHLAIVHGAKIGKNCIIGMHSTILNGAVIGENCMIGAGSIVMQNQVIPPNSVVMGVPAKVKKVADEKTLAAIRRNWEIYCNHAKAYRKSKYHQSK